MPKGVYTRVIEDPNERFDTKVRIDWITGCHEWTASRSKAGYGQFSYGSSLCILAHRWAYQRKFGELPEELHHVCHNPACVNPDHLEAMTKSSHARINWQTQKTNCPHGHEYSEENTYIVKPTGHRRCKECVRIRDSSPSKQQYKKEYNKQWMENNKEYRKEYERRRYERLNNAKD